MPQIAIIAGPNGAGKTTFASEYLSTDLRFEFVNADEIARRAPLEVTVGGSSDVRAGRIMLNYIDDSVEAGANFMIETTLATLIYAQKIPAWRERGYFVSLIYLRLGSVDESIARVRKRVEAGGHGIPEETIRRRFGKSNAYFETRYKFIVDAWYLYESKEGSFALLESSQ